MFGRTKFKHNHGITISKSLYDKHEQLFDMVVCCWPLVTTLVL